jgi:hypothetical protein
MLFINSNRYGLVQQQLWPYICAEYTQKLYTVSIVIIIITIFEPRTHMVYSHVVITRRCCPRRVCPRHRHRRRSRRRYAFFARPIVSIRHRIGFRTLIDWDVTLARRVVLRDVSLRRRAVMFSRVLRVLCDWLRVRLNTEFVCVCV